ncbi:MAG: PH domain-containing protein [Candidatus Saccharibacteria bacterium]|nr:PH domain-containing protein [Candidatus Saccharibacteria bacterium]
MDEGLVKIRHDRSVKDFPFLNLADDEYVEYAFKRAKICLFLIYAGVLAGMIAILVAFFLISMGAAGLDSMGQNFMYIILTTLLVVVVITGIFATMVYRGNKLFITNKRVIQKVMISPVASSTNMVDLTSVEDVSYSQSGLMQMMFHYGTFRLSTVGDETTYTFKYSDISGDDLKMISKLVTSVKKQD